MQCSKPPPRTAGSMHSTAAGSTAPQIRRFLPWPGTRGDFGPWRVCSLDEFSEPKDDLKGSLKCRLKNKPQAPGGGSNVSHPLIADRRRRFARKKSKLNTNSPPPGGGSNLCSLSLCGPAGLQRADFFPSSPNFRAPHRSRAGGVSLQINVRPPRRAPIQRFISRPWGPPRGRQISAVFRSETGGPAHIVRRDVGGNIFCSIASLLRPVPVSGVRKIAAKFRVGGG
jgi:hypothetical protein